MAILRTDVGFVLLGFYGYGGATTHLSEHTKKKTFQNYHALSVPRFTPIAVSTPYFHKTLQATNVYLSHTYQLPLCMSAF